MTNWDWKISLTVDASCYGRFEDFKARWFVHRIALSMWIVTGFNPKEFLTPTPLGHAYPPQSKARSLCCWMLREHFDFPQTTIARAMNISRTSVIRSCLRVERALKIPESWERETLTSICQQPEKEL